MTGARLVAVALSSVTLGVVGCGGSSGGSGGAAAKNITIAGTLDAGSVTSALTGGSSALSVSSPLALAGYKLYCVTFNTPPVSGTAAADAAGSVSLTLAAQNVPFGCFILDAAGQSIATLTFKSDTQIGQTVTFAGDANLGAITVDASNGLAQAAVPATATLVTTTPSSVACPVGIWSFTEVSSGGGSTGTVWIAQTSSSTYSMSVTGTNTDGSVFSLPNLPTTYAGGVTTVGPFQPEGSSCAEVVGTIVLTANSACTELTGTLTKTGCTQASTCGCNSHTITATKR